MAKIEKDSKEENEFEYDPLEELNEMNDDLTIETEKDYFDEIEQSDLDSIPEYDSQSGKIIEDSKSVSEQENSNKESFHLMGEIDEVEFNNVNSEDKSDNQKALTKDVKPQKPKTTHKKGKKFSLSSKLGLKNDKKDKKPIAKPKKQVHTFNDESLKDDTQVIDNVKVDNDGVPLLNQFDTDKIKESTIIPKITVRRISLTKIVMIVLGLIITLVGILQAMNDVVKVSDHVMYGEHESFAMGLIFLGIIIIILAFYKELMKLVGLNNLEIMDDIDTTSKSKRKNKKTEKK